MDITIKIHTPDKVPNATTAAEIRRAVEEALTPQFPLIESIEVSAQ